MRVDSLKPNALTRRLGRSLLITLTAVLILATVAAGITAYLEASDSQDETLLSVARLLETNQIEVSGKHRSTENEGYDDNAVQVWISGERRRIGPTINDARSHGFRTLLHGDDFWRVYVTREITQSQRFIVAQKLEVSTELALTSAFNTALPLLALFMIVPVLVALIIRHSLRPLNQLAEKVQRTDSLQLDFMHKKDIPSELLPFISAIESLLEKNAVYNARQRRFIADAAHELRTPIAALSLQLENLQSATDEIKKAERQKALERGLQRLQRLISQLLDFARAQAAPDEELVTVSLNELVKQQIAELYPLVEEKALILSVSRNEAVALADSSHQLQHLIRNALSNAIKYTPPDGSVSVEIFTDSGSGVFSVSDSGPGVDEKEIANLSRPFYRSETQTSGQGAGLGLAICYEIAARLLGQITLANENPSGFRFTYRQPLRNP